MVKKWSTASLVLMLVLSIALSACGNGNNGKNADNSPNPGSDSTATPAKETPKAEEVVELEPVELSYYFVGTPQKDIAEVEEAMNKILKEKINATIKLNLIDWGSFGQKLNVMQAGGEPYDLVFVAPWMGNYYQGVSKGAYLPLDDLLDQYAPKLKAAVPAKIWDATRVDGKIYGSINWQIVAVAYGFEVRKDLAEKYSLDVNSIVKYEDLEPFYEQIVKNEKDVTPVVVPPQMIGAPTFYGMDSIGDDQSPGWIHLNDSNLKVVNQYESDEFKQSVQLSRSWYTKGYVRKDIAQLTDVVPLMKAGKFASKTNLPIKPGVEIEDKALWGTDVQVKSLSKAMITTSRAIATMTAISKTSKNPERAMMFLELINSDKELYNLLSHGIEGKHYKVVSDNLIEVVAQDNGYNPSTDWMFGNQFNSYYISPTQVGSWEKTEEMNASADYSPIIGFNFNPDPVKTELAQTDAVLKQYGAPLSLGVADPDKILPEFLDKLKQAGVDKIIAEKQKQLDAWKASKS